MRLLIILFVLFSLVTIGGAGPVLPPQQDGRLVHPNSPLDIITYSQHNNISWLQNYPMDLTGLPGWIIFKTEPFKKDGNIGPKFAHYRWRLDFYVQNKTETLETNFPAYKDFDLYMPAPYGSSSKRYM